MFPKATCPTCEAEIEVVKMETIRIQTAPEQVPLKGYSYSCPECGCVLGVHRDYVEDVAILFETRIDPIRRLLQEVLASKNGKSKGTPSIG
ncbi:MAG: hypothetical protein KJ072_27995, partial [Verrucomicrobia bacterium]|nr:hypothetical protein [Verrucomicrobiota bacterium]